MKNLIFASILFFCSGCTLNFIQTETSGGSEEKVDTKSEESVDPQMTVPALPKI